MFPRRSLDLSHWLADWIRKGAVPIATLNLQKGVKQGQTVPDAWHHQASSKTQFSIILSWDSIQFEIKARTEIDQHELKLIFDFRWCSAWAPTAST